MQLFTVQLVKELSCTQEELRGEQDSTPDRERGWERVTEEMQLDREGWAARDRGEDGKSPASFPCPKLFPRNAAILRQTPQDDIRTQQWVYSHVWPQRTSSTLLFSHLCARISRIAGDEKSSLSSVSLCSLLLFLVSEDGEERRGPWERSENDLNEVLTEAEGMIWTEHTAVTRPPEESSQTKICPPLISAEKEECPLRSVAVTVVIWESHGHEPRCQQRTEDSEETPEEETFLHHSLLMRSRLPSQETTEAKRSQAKRWQNWVPTVSERAVHLQ
jgi:hypothetical protein